MKGSTELWREAYEHFGQLADLEGDVRDRALEALGRSRPDLYPHLSTLVRAHAEAQAGAFLSTPPIGFPAPHLPLASGSTLGTYRLEHELGSGGMGEVWLAHRADGLFEAPVALKLLHAHLCASSVRDRFVREGRILGQLSHPHIARLLDAGSFADGRMFLAIEYVEGDRIDRWCDVRRLSITARVRLFVQVCEAVAHAHARLVVHRDLKPSNILVTPGGEVKLLDFGIAKLIEPDTSKSEITELTRLGGRAMTPEYAAPEQVLGRAITTATDVYSLGMVLYVLLTGRRPYGVEGATLSEIERAVVEAEPEVPSAVRQTASPSAADVAGLRGTTATQLRAALRGDLDTIVMKALKKAPADRYPSVDALAEDLRRVLDHRPVAARPDSFGYRARKYVRRHRVAVTAGLAVTLALAIGMAGALHQAREARIAQQAEERARHAAEDAERRALDSAARVTRSKDFFVQIFQGASAFHRKGTAVTSVDAALDDAIRRIDTDVADDPRFQADLLDDFGELRVGQGDFAAARTMFDRAIALHEKHSPPDDPALAESLQNRGVLETYAGTPDVAVPFLERAVKVLEHHPRTHAGALAAARSNLATLIWEQSGRMDEAQVLVESAIEVLRDTPDRPWDLASALSYASMIAQYDERTTDAEALASEALALIERLFGPDTPNAIAVLNILGITAAARGDPVASAAHQERRLAIARKAFSGGHVLTIDSLSDVVRVSLAMERFDRAETLVREGAALIEGMEPAYPRGKAQLRLLEADLATRRDDRPIALALYESAAVICGTVAGDHRTSVCAPGDAEHARLLAELGRGDEALVLVDGALARLQQTRHAEDTWLAGRERVAILSSLGRHAESVAAARALLASQERRGIDTRRAQWVLGEALLDLGGPDATREAMRWLAQKAPASAGAIERAHVAVLRARLATAQGRTSDAARERAEAIALLESRLPWSRRDLRRAQEDLR